MTGTFAMLLIILGVMMTSGQAITMDGEVTDTGGRVALIALALAALVPAAITRLDLTPPPWISWAVGGLSLTITTTLWGLVAARHDALAWSAYGGLQVLRGRANFNDMDWDVRWLDCDLCEQWNPHYGPALAWAKPLSFGLINVNWVPYIGFAMAIASVVGGVWLIRRSGPRGVIVMAIALLGPAWLLQQDRANLDGLVFLAIVGGAWLVSRRESLLTWSLFAAFIWVNGALKYYPFAVGLALLPALRLRRGWTVVVGFLIASVGLMTFAWSDFQDSLRWNSNSIYVPWDFPAYGRLMLLDRMGPLGETTGLLGSGSLLVIALAMFATAWGFGFALRLRTRSVVETAMALGGSAVFLITILLGGFGFMYKGVFLLPLVPLLSRPLRSRSADLRLPLYTSLVALTLIVFATTFAYASVLTTLAGIVSASIGLGAGLGVLWRLLRPTLVPTDAAQPRESANSSQASTAAS